MIDREMKFKQLLKSYGVLKDQEDKNDYNKALLDHFNIVDSSSLLVESFRNSFYNC